MNYNCDSIITGVPELAQVSTSSVSIICNILSDYLELKLSTASLTYTQEMIAFSIEHCMLRRRQNNMHCFTGTQVNSRAIGFWLNI